MTCEIEIEKKFPHLHVSRETYDKFEFYQKQIQKWNKAFSLVQEKTLQEFASRHLCDSLQLIQYIPDQNASIIDIGTGAGFPGMVLAMYGYPQVTLIESNAKKVVFLNELSRQTNTQVNIFNVRAETISEKFDFVASRACSSLTNLLSLMKNVSRETTQGIFHKGETHMAEIEEATRKWNFRYDLHPSMTESKSRIIIVRNLELK